MGEVSTSSAGAGRGGAAGKRLRLLQKQPVMFRMLLALAPLAVSAVYFFGWRALAVVAVCNAAGFVTELVMARRRGRAVSTACFVTCCLYALSMPPTVPLWVAVVGVVVAILFGKEVFGGFGRNVANPAIVGRAFVYVCFPNDLTGRFVPVFRGLPGGFAHWSFETFGRLPDYLASSGRGLADAVTQASPLWVFKRLGEDAVTRADGASTWDLLTGSIGGTFQADGQTRILVAGSLGEGCALLVIAAAAFLLLTRTANWRLMLSGLAGIAAANVLFRNVLGAAGVAPLAVTLLAGTALFATVFMVTDPVSAPKRKGAMLAYGAIIGALMVFIRWRGIFVAAASFSILLGNLVAPLLDAAAEAWQARRKARRNAPAQPTGEA